MIHSLRNAGITRQTARHLTHLFLPILLFICCPRFIFCQTGQDQGTGEFLKLSPKDAVELAIQNNLSLENARITLDTKQRKADLVWNQFLPTFSVNGILSRDNWATTSQGMDLSSWPPTTYSITLPQWHVAGSLSASWNFSFALVAGIQTILSDYQAGLVTFEKARLQLERDIRKMYNQILLTNESAVLLRENYENVTRQAAIAEANYNAGLVPRLSWLQAQVAVENMRPTLNEMENGIKAQKANFAMTLGLPYDTEFEFEKFDGGNFSIPMDLSELISKAASGKPDILELQKNITVLQNSRKAMALQLLTPYLNLSWNLNTAFIRDPWKDNWFDYDSWRGSGSFNITLGISLNNLFPFTKEGQGIKDLDNSIRALNIALAQVIRGTELEIFTKVNSLENTQTSMEVQRAAVELAELSYRLTEEAYRAGLQDFQTVRSSALALEQAKYQLLSQQFSYINDLIDLEYAVGVPFGTLSSRY